MKQQLSWLCYYIPLRWTFSTRYINIINIISFFLIDAFPSLYIVITLGSFSFETIFYWGISFFVMFCFYECGYIFNEVISVRYEENPTIRIPQPFFDGILKHLENLVTLRIVMGTIGSLFLLTRYPNNWKLYVFEVLLLLSVYTIHNFFRSRINAVTMPLEVTLKYMIPITIFIPDNKLNIALFTVFISIVLIRLIEYISKKKYMNGFNVIKNVDKYRVKYYIASTVFMLLLSYARVIPLALCGLPVFFLIYRVFCYYAMHHLISVSSIIHKGRKMHKTEQNNEEIDSQ